MKLDAGPERFDAVVRWIAISLALGLLLAESLLALRGSIRFQLDYQVNDDVFYYLQWAWNLAHGNGPTFDGINPTNGVQPLWALLLTGAAALGLSKPQLLSAALLLSAMFNGISVLGIYGTLRRLVTPAVQLLGLACWVHLNGSLQLMQSGLEISINVACSSLLMATCLRYVTNPTQRVALWLGILSSLVFLCRVDNVIYVGFVGALVVWFGRRTPELQRCVRAFALPSAGTIAGYMLLNTILFQHPMPISGRIKAYSQRIDEVDRLGGYLSPAYWQLVPPRLVELLQRLVRYFVPNVVRERLDPMLPTEWWFLGLTVLLIGIVLIRRTWSLPRAAWAWGVMLGATILHAVMLVALVGKYIVYTVWYFPWQHMMLNHSVMLLVDRAGATRSGLRSRWRSFWTVGCCVAALLLLLRAATLFVYHHWENSWPYDRGNFLQVRHDVALWMRDALPPGAVVASFNAGQLGYYSEHPVIDLDGLVNSAELLNWHRDRRPLTEYLDFKGVSFIVDWEFGPAASHTTFHHIPRERLELLQSWPVPRTERTFYAFRYAAGGPTPAFTPFLGNVEDYP